MGGACSTYGAEKRRIQGFGGEIRGKEITWKVDLDRRKLRDCTMDVKKSMPKLWVGLIWLAIRTSGGLL